MVDSDKFTPGDEDERDRRLIQDLHRMYHAKVEDASPLARIRKRLAESSAGILYNSPKAPQQHDVLGMHWERPGNVNSTRSSFAEGKTWQQRTGAIAAVVFVTLLVGSLVVVLTRAHQSSTGGPENTLQVFGALSSIHMVDTQTGWAVTGKGRIVRTTDGGVHWKDVTPKYPSSLPLADQQSVVADFLTSSMSWIAVSNADAAATLLFRTSDGGQTWQKTTIPTAIVTQITFIDSQHGWVLSKNPVSASAETVEVYSSTDGGGNWAMVSAAYAASTDTPPPGQLPFGGTKTGLGFLNATTGWATGSFLTVKGYILLYATHDGGSKWYPQTLPLSSEEASSHLSISPPLFFTATDGLLPVSSDTENGSSIDFYVTQDGGASWKGTSPVVALASDSDFIDVNHGWASDGTHLYMTSDGGQTWTKLSPGANFKNVSRLNFVSSDTGWAIGSTADNLPSLLTTVDGGHTWTVIS